jgi:hypothetical protein
LEAFRVVEEWKEGVAGTDATTSLVDVKLDNTTERAIASSMECRELARAKRKSRHLVVTIDMQGFRIGDTGHDSGSGSDVVILFRATVF